MNLIYFLSYFFPFPSNNNFLLHKLLQPLIRHGARLAVKPDDDEAHKTSNDRPQACNPNPAAANLPAARVLIVGKVADGDFVLFVHVCEERTLVVDSEREDTVLIGKSERSAVDCAILRAGSGCERKAVVRREHGEFKLDGVGGFNLERDIVAAGIFGQLNAEGLSSNMINIRESPMARILEL